MRGFLVPFESVTTNEVFGTPSIEDATFESWIAIPDYELIFHTLCYSGSTWKTSGTYIIFLENFLKRMLNFGTLFWLGV